MKSYCRSKMTQWTILLGIAVLMNYSIANSSAFFLNNLVSETKPEESQISTKPFSSDTPTIIDTNPDTVDRKDSENVEQSSTQVVNSVKDIVSVVLDKHTAISKTDEKNQNEITADSDNDIPSPEELVTNLKLDSNDPPLSIIQLQEPDNEDVATALENSIRSSVKDEIQIDQIFESSAIDNIPDPDVRQTLTDELMAVEYPQGVKKSDEKSTEELKPIIAKDENKIQPTTERTIENASNGIVPGSNHTANKTSASVQTTTIPAETEITPRVDKADHNIVVDAEVDTTPATDIVSEFTLIPTEEIVHSMEELHDNEETKPIRIRQMRGFSEESKSKSESESNEIASETKDNSVDSDSEKSKASDSSDDSSASSDSSSKESSVVKDENVGAEEKSGESDVVFSQDASIEENFEKESTFITPARPIQTSEFTNSPIELEGVTESSGELLDETTANPATGKHIVIKKPGVGEEVFLLNTTAKPVVDATDVPSDNSAAPTGEEARIEPNSIIDEHKSLTVPTVTETSVTQDMLKNVVTAVNDETLVPNNQLLEKGNASAVDLDPLTASAPLENAPRILKGIHNDTSKADTGSLGQEDMDKKEQSQLSNPDIPVVLENEEQIDVVQLKKDVDEHKEANTPAPDGQMHVLQLNSSSETPIPEITTASETITNDASELSLVPLVIEEQVITESSLSDQESTPEQVTESKQDQLSESVHQKDQQSTSMATLEIEPATLPIDDVHTTSKVSILETSTEAPATVEPSFVVGQSNEISKHLDDAPLSKTPELTTSTPKPNDEELESITFESSTEKPITISNEDLTTAAKSSIETIELTTEAAHREDSFHTSSETAAISDEIVSPAVAGRTFNTIIAEGLGKALPTRSVGDEPSTSSYSSEDKTTTVVVLCSAGALIFVAFSVAMYLITFQRQHGTLDIEMQEQRCGKDDLRDDEDAETRVTLLNQNPPIDSDEQSFD